MNSMVEVLAAYADNQPKVLFAADASAAKYTYREAWLTTQYIAEKLQKEAGIQKEDKVMVECCQDTAFLLVDFACQLIGAVFVPIENTASYDRKKSIYQETEANLWISHGEVLDFVKTITFDQLLPESTATLHTANKPLVFPSKEDMAEILYTTGTTGKSKGIMIANGANIALAENIKYGVNMAPHSVEFIPIPISHSHGLRCCYANLLNGGSIVLIDGLMNTRKVFQLIEDYGVTAMDISPSAAQFLIKVSKGKFWDYGKKMDYIQIGTAALPEQLKEQLIRELPGVHLYNFYGSTESGRSCVLDFSRNQGKKNCIGRATRNSEIIFTTEDRRPMEATEENPGLLASRGSMNMLGYWKNEELTLEIMKDNYIFTNDLGYMDAEGYIYVLGRKDDVINYNGIKIAPEEIEAVAIRYPGIKDAACVPMPDKIAGQAPRLFISTDVYDFDLRVYIDYLTKHLDGNKLPKKVDIIPEIPRTGNGKIKRKDLIEI